MSPVLPIVKIGAGVLAGIPVSKIVTDIIKNNVTVVTKMDTFKVASGSVVIGVMVSTAVKKATDELIDAIVDIKQTIVKTKETEEIEKS